MSVTAAATVSQPTVHAPPAVMSSRESGGREPASETRGEMESRAQTRGVALES